MEKHEDRTDLMVLFICIFCLITIFAATVMSALEDTRRDKQLSGVDGHYDVDGAALLSDGKLPIKTLWEHYSGIHLISDEADGMPTQKLIYLPMDWSMFDKNAWGGNGKASYRIFLEQLPDAPIVLRFNGISPKMSIFVNGVIQEDHSQRKENAVELTNIGDSCEIILEVSSSWLSGVYACPWLYTKANYETFSSMTSSIWIFSLGGFFTAFLFGSMLLRKLKERGIYRLFSRSFIFIGTFYMLANAELSGRSSVLYDYIPFEQLHLLIAALAACLGVTAVSLQARLFPDVFHRKPLYLIAWSLFISMLLKLFIGAYVDMDIMIVCLAACFVAYQVLCIFNGIKKDSSMLYISLATILIGLGISVTAIRSTQHQLYGAQFLLPVTLLCAILFYANFWSIVFSRLESAAERENEAREKQINAEMAYLTSQIQPHFQYNTLTMIQELCYTDPMKAADAIVLYSAFLRRRVDFNKFGKLVPFTHELENIDDYIALQYLRFQDTIQFERDIRVSDFMIPPLAIQTLVENAVYHGLRKNKTGGGVVYIGTREEDGNIVIRINDNGAGFDTETITDNIHGSGIENCRFRIESLLGGSIKIESEVGKGTKVTIYLPKGARNNEDHSDR